MAEWAWPWSRRASRRHRERETTGQMRQEAALVVAELRRERRSLEEAIRQLMDTQAERGVEDE